MKFYVNDSCIGCTLCANSCPDVFSMNNYDRAEAIESDVPEILEDDAEQAMNDCPVNAIEKKD